MIPRVHSNGVVEILWPTVATAYAIDLDNGGGILDHESVRSNASNGAVLLLSIGKGLPSFASPHGFGGPNVGEAGCERAWKLSETPPGSEGSESVPRKEANCKVNGTELGDGHPAGHQRERPEKLSESHGCGWC